MKYLFRGGRRKVAAVMTIALVASLSQVASSSASPVVSAKYGGNIKVGIFDSFPGYCMADNLANSALMGARTIYETWVEQRSDGKIVPYLLKSWAHSADNKTWKLTVRDGIKFHDGTAVDGAALLTNLQALRGVLTLQGKAPSPGTAGGFTANIDKVVLTGPMEVTVYLYQAESEYPDSLYASGRFFARAPSQILSGAKCSTTPIGTGAFKLVSTKLSELVVTKNTTYWRKAPNGDKLPYLDGITFTFLSEVAPRVQGVKSGALDAVMFTSAAEAKQIIDIRNVTKVKTILSPADYYPSVWLNHNIAPFNSRNARLAFSFAMDRAKFVKVRQKGLGGVPTSIVGPNNIMYNTRAFQNFDLVKAKRYVADYKAETGKDLVFSMPYASGSVESLANGQMIKTFGAAAGFTVNLTPFTVAEIIQRAFPQQFQAMSLLLMEGTGTAFIFPFIVSDMSGGNPNWVLKGTPLAILSGILNLSRFSDPVSESLLRSARATSDQTKKAVLYKRATLRLQQEAHMTNLIYQQYAFTYGSKVQGVGVLPLVAGGARRLVTNFGIDWTGVWKSN
ncbi:MAG: ABC transporter substrate-binding protein [Ilumatobacteraceae bacterium]